jgi:hypothetical protein
MDPIEIIAVIVAVIILLKALMLLFVPSKSLVRMSKKWLTDNHSVSLFLQLVAVVVVGYYVFSLISVVTIAVVVLFSSLVFGLMLNMYPKGVTSFVAEIMKNKKYILLMYGVWVAFAVVILWVVFG